MLRISSIKRIEKRPRPTKYNSIYKMSHSGARDRPTHEETCAMRGLMAKPSAEIRRRFGDLDLESFGDMLRFHVRRISRNRFGADEGGEGILAIFILRSQIIFFIEKLAVLERRPNPDRARYRIRNKGCVRCPSASCRGAARCAKARTQKPDMRDRRRERNMPHALAPYPRQCNFDAAFLADDALVFHPLVFAAQALVILDRRKSGAKQAIRVRV